MDFMTAFYVVIAGAIALLGALFGNKLGKSTGRKEGAAQAVQGQQVTQAKEAVKAVKERQNVEVELAADTDAELDARLSKHNRAD